MLKRKVKSKSSECEKYVSKCEKYLSKSEKIESNPVTHDKKIVFNFISL